MHGVKLLIGILNLYSRKKNNKKNVDFVNLVKIIDGNISKTDFFTCVQGVTWMLIFMLLFMLIC